MAAWVLHAWAHDSFDISPVLGIVIPEKRCGKTTALSVVSALTPRAMHAINISASVLFRVIEKYKPTVMVDEADTFLDADKNGDLRGMLNGGHNRLSAYVWRSVGDDHEPRRFKVWAPKVVAMIGNLPDTLEDRSLVVRLRRKRDGEAVERFRADRINDFLHLRQRAARWVKDHALTLANADPLVPDALHDRAQDNARCICAIADAVGGHWPVTIRAALVGMHQEVEADEPQSAGVLLLRDVAEIFEAKRAERIGSTDLLNALCALEESPWSEWRGGRPISTRGIAKLLKSYGIEPKRDMSQRFYGRADFADAFNRYLSDGTEKSVTSDTSVMHGESVIKKHNKNNNNDGYDACDASGSHDVSKRHADGWEGEI
jgi:putative DNA primase/helicase